MTASPARRQRGAALLALLAVIMLGAAWFLLSAIQPSSRVALERTQNAKVLGEAKRALLAYVAARAIDRNEDYPGRLPCPEGAQWVGVANADGIAAPGIQQGVAAPTCSTIGRLPWRTLGIDKLQDAAGEPLWYVVSTGPTGWALLNSTTALTINSNKANNLSVDGTLNQAVAAIIAPGAPLHLAPTANQIAAGCAARTQVRTPSAPNYLDYLECQNIVGPTLRTAVVDNSINPVFNDQVIIITAADVLDAIEPVVAERIKRDVVPHLQSAYVNTSWGGTVAEPYFPFPVAYPAPPTAFDAAASDFKGTVPVVTAPQGLLPMTASTCNSLTAGRCDANFVAWVPATATGVRTGGDPTLTFSADCSASTATLIDCRFDYLVLLCLSCSVSVDVRIQATASNAGRAVRTLDSSFASGLTGPTLTAPLQADGSALGTYVGSIPTNSGVIPGLCGTLVGLLCTATNVHVTIPIGVFQEQLANPATSDNWYWFTANNWHQVTYYAVSQANAPGGARNCAGAGNNCLNVTLDVGAALTGKRAILGLAGRSVRDTTGSTRALDDFLDTAANVDFNSTFEQKRNSRSGIAGSFSPKGAFNDRFVSVTP